MFWRIPPFHLRNVFGINVMKIVGLIPARGGSKGINKKNIHPCAGKPLIAHTIEAALGSKLLSETIVSTDNVEIANVSEQLGVVVPFIRPGELSTDQASSVVVMNHALDFLEKSGKCVDAIALLQPTSPLRTCNHIDEATKIFLSELPDTLVSVVKVPHSFHEESLMKIDRGVLKPQSGVNEKVLRRQNAKEIYARNGPAILIVSAKQIKRGNFYGGITRAYVMDTISSIDIDNIQDLIIAEALLHQLGHAVNG